MILSIQFFNNVLRVSIFTFLLLGLLSLLVVPAEGSGFMLWTRRYNEENPTNGNYSIYASVADVTVIIIPNNKIDIVNSTTGELLLNLTDITEGLDLATVITPAISADGQPLCSPLFNHTQMFTGNINPWNGNWCGIFLMSSIAASTFPIILLPNGAIVPFVSMPSWSCSPTSPCIIRSTEQRENQVGGCPQIPASLLQNSRAFGTESSLVTVIDGKNAFIFRPLSAIYSPQTAIKSVILDGWASSIAFPDSELMFQPISYFMDKGFTSSFTSAAQGVVCALVLVGDDGFLQLYDTDRDDTSEKTGLALIGNFSAVKDSPSGVCTPSVQTALQLIPAPSIKVPRSSPTPLLQSLYQTIFSVTCNNGKGYLWNAVVNLNNSVSSVPTTTLPYSLTWLLSGNFQLPPLGAPRLGIPLSIVVEIILVQPTISIANYYSNSTSDGTDFSYLSSHYCYLTCISGSRIFFNEPSPTNDVTATLPIVSLMVFKSNFGDSTENATATNEPDISLETSLLNLTQTMVSTLAPEVINVTGNRNIIISNVMGWVHATQLPAIANATVTSIPDEDGVYSDPWDMISALEIRILNTTSQWFAYHGTTFSVLADDCLVFVNITTGSTVAITPFRSSTDGTQLYGGVADASTSRVGPSTYSKILPQVLSWQSYPSGITVAVNRSAPTITHTKVLVTVNPPSSDVLGTNPLCVYTMVGSAGAALVLANLIFTQMGDIATDVFPIDNQMSADLSWAAQPQNRPLLDTFSQSVCTVQLPANTNQVSRTIPAGESIFLSQIFWEPNQPKSVRISANPVRSVVETTSLTSFDLDNNSATVANLNITILDPIGTPYVFVCAGHILYIYYGSTGNLSSSIDLTSTGNLSSSCTCPSSNDALLLSKDTNFVLLTLVNGSTPNSPNALLVYEIQTQKLKVATSGLFLDEASDECTSGASNAPFVPVFSPLVEITILPDGGQFGGIFTFVGTRCFSLLTVQKSSTLSVTVSVFFFLGSLAAFSSTIIYHGDNLYLSNLPTSDADATFTVWSFSLANLFQLSDSSDKLLYGVLPLFATSGVLDFVVANSLLLVAMGKQQQQLISVAAFDPSSSSMPVWTTSMHQLYVSVWSMVRIFSVQDNYACLAAGSLVCYYAGHTLAPPIAIQSSEVFPIGDPAVDQLGNIVFATKGYRMHAYNFANKSLTLLWASPSWPGQNESVDMNINASTCSNPLISDEGLVVECSPLFNPMSQFVQRHLSIIDVRTGTVLLADGPRVVPSSSALADDGQHITYASSLGSVATINLVGTLELVGVPIVRNLCSRDLSNNYVVSFNLTSITAIKVPWNTSEKATVRTYAGELLAQRWRAYRGLRLGNAFAFSNSSGILRTLWDALPGTVRGCDSFNIFVGDNVQIMDDSFGYTLMDTSQCAVCLVNCPSYCAVSLVSGVQRNIAVNDGFITIRIKPYGQELFDVTESTQPILFSGNITLSLQRYQQDMFDLEQVIDCNLNKTIVATSGRYCLLVSNLNRKRWVVVEVAPNIATTAVYQSYWGNRNFSQVQSSMAGNIYSVGNVVAINNLLWYGSVNKSFVQYLPNGMPFSAILRATTDYSSQSLAVLTDVGVYNFTTTACEEMAVEIQMCSTSNLRYTTATANNELKTVEWNSTGTNWGDGFVTVGYPVKLSSVLRTIIDGEPQGCGRADDTCVVACQPDSSCESQVFGYWGNWLMSMSLLPSGSTVPYPGILLQACKNVTGNASYTPFPNTDQVPWDPAVIFQCISGNEVALTARLDQWFGENNDVILLAILYSSAYVAGGAHFSCTPCTYFFLKGIMPQSIGWFALIALKNLIVYIIFYFILEHAKQQYRNHENRFASGRRSSNTIDEESQPLMDAQSRESSSTLNDNVEQPYKLFNISGPFHWYAVILTKCGMFRHRKDKEIQQNRIKSNLIPLKLSEEQLLERLKKILGVSLIASEEFNGFSVFYQDMLCHDRQWVVREIVDDPHHQATLTDVHQKLKECYGAYQKKHHPLKERRGSQSSNGSLKSMSSQDANGQADAQHVMSIASSENVARRDSQQFNRYGDIMDAFETYFDNCPYCFEYAYLPIRQTDNQLLPSALFIAILLTLNIVVILVLITAVLLRNTSGQEGSMSGFEVYQVICFILFNSPLPSALIVNVVARADLSTPLVKFGSFNDNSDYPLSIKIAYQISDAKAKVKGIFNDPAVCFTLLLYAAPLITHVIPGFFWYIWLLPIILFPCGIEYCLRMHRRDSHRYILLRFCSRFLILFVAAVVMSLSFNYSAALHLIPRLFELEGGSYKTGSFDQDTYWGIVRNDWNARSFTCTWDHLVQTFKADPPDVINYLQMGIFP